MWRFGPKNPSSFCPKSAKFPAIPRECSGTLRENPGNRFSQFVLARFSQRTVVCDQGKCSDFPSSEASHKVKPRSHVAAELRAQYRPRLADGCGGRRWVCLSDVAVASGQQLVASSWLKTAILVAAAIICAVRTAREEDIMPASPRIVSKVADSIRLARMLWDRIIRNS